MFCQDLFKIISFFNESIIFLESIFIVISFFPSSVKVIFLSFIKSNLIILFLDFKLLYIVLSCSDNSFMLIGSFSRNDSSCCIFFINLFPWSVINILLLEKVIANCFFNMPIDIFISS